MHHGTARAALPCLGLAALLLAGAAHAQNNTGMSCETLRAQIEARIAASGVTDFSVTVADADAPTHGQAVGSCALGTRKIVYERQGMSGSAAPGAARPAGARGTPMLTECKDGTTSVGGDCRK